MNRTPAAEESALKEEVARAYQVLAANGQGDTIFGHVSGRLPGWDRFWMKPSRIGLEEVTADCLILLDLEGQVLDGDRPRHEEFPIHAEVMRARPDVLAVVHTHPLHSIALAARGSSLRPVSHEGSYFWPPEIPVFDQFTDLVRTAEQGAAVAAGLGDRPALFLLNHGIVVTGSGPAEACEAAIILERAAQVQLLAEGAASRPVRHTSEEEALRKRGTAWRAGRLDAIFDYHTRRLGEDRASTERP